MGRETVSRTNMAIDQPVPTDRTLKAPMDVEQEHIPYYKVFSECVGHIFQTNAKIIAGVHTHGFPFFGSSGTIIIKSRINGHIKIRCIDVKLIAEFLAGD